MKSETPQQERECLEKKIREIRTQMIREIERRRFLGLDQQVRRVQKQFALLKRI